MEAVRGRRSPSLRTAAVAISFLFSYVEPGHEQRLADAAARGLPGRARLASPARSRRSGASTSAARPRSWTPTSSPSSARFAGGPRARASTDRRISGWHALMRSNGGQVAAEAMPPTGPVEMVLSGLAGGHDRRQPLGAAPSARDKARHAGHGRHVRRRRRRRRRAAPQFSGLFEVEWGMPIALPIIDVTTIGAGGCVDRLASTTAACSRSAPRAPAPTRARPATAWAARSPPITDANLVIGPPRPRLLPGRRDRPGRTVRAACHRAPRRASWA